MAFDEDIAQRIRSALLTHAGLSERKMFGGVCFMVNGNMFAGLIGDELMLRVGPDRFEELLARPGVRPMDFTGRPMHGFIYVAAPAFATDLALSNWLGAALSFVEALPPKQPGAPRSRRKKPA